MRRRVLSLVLLASTVAVPVTVRAEGGATVTGRVLSTSNGLPVAGASVELDRNGGKVAATTTGVSGGFRFQNEPAGEYSLVVAANGFVTTRQDVLVTSGQSQVSLQLAIAPTRGLREIAAVSVSAQAALQASTTINEHVNAINVQTQNYARIGDTLIGVPGVNTQTGSSVGDDLGVSIRGFNSTETATLLDGHQIGPIGAFGNGYDYQVSPFWGLSGVDVIFGSGATGIYGASTIAGAVNFRTIDPTEKPTSLITQGIGDNAKLLTGVQFTGTIGKLGYAFAQGVQGTYGNFAPQYYLQNGLLGTDFRTSNLDANTYVVTGDYLLRNTVGKIVYSFDPRTTLTLTTFAATSWDDKSGNGDNDFNPFPYTLYNAEQNIANNPVTKVRLPSGKVAKCHHTIAVLSDAAQGYSCLTAEQWASVAAGPSGGGPGPWQAIRNQDYHARLQTTVGVNQIVADLFLDHYALDYNRSEAGGGYNTSVYDTNGLLLGDEIAGKKNDLAFGYYWQNQYQGGDAYPTVDIFGNLTNVQSNYAVLQLSNSNEYIRDSYQFSNQFSAFGEFWLQQLVQIRSNSFNPRLSFIYRPTNADVLRLTGGKANSVPDPSLLYAPPSFNTTPSNINPTCGPHDLTAIGSISNPNLVPETADDVELSYGHRFHGGVTASVDVYSTYEHDALQNGTLPLSALGQTSVPESLIQEYLNRISQVCGTHPTKANLAVTTTYNAAAARYQGLQWAITWNPTRNLLFDAEYDTQSAAFLSIPDSILQQNVTTINGAQIAGIPLHKATATLSYGNRGFNAQLIGNYIGPNNNYARQGFWFANANVSQSVGGITVALSANNLFDSAAQRWGYFGYGTYVPENKYGTDTSAFQQGTEQFGLPYRQVFFTISERF
ncbi:MAG TPA: TonB-dependent receptor [Candidatus Cybelea sp.]